MPKLKKKSIEQRSRADKERKQQIRGKSLHVGNLSEYNTNSQEREFSHETALLHAEGASSNIGNCTGTEKNDGSKQSSAIEMKYTISKLNEPYVAETIVDRYCGLAKFIGTAWALWAQQCHKEKIKASRQVRVYLYRLFRDGGTCGWGVHTPICLLFGVIHWSRRPRGISAFNVALVILVALLEPVIITSFTDIHYVLK